MKEVTAEGAMRALEIYLQAEEEVLAKKEGREPKPPITEEQFQENVREAEERARQILAKT